MKEKLELIERVGKKGRPTPKMLATSEFLHLTCCLSFVPNNFNASYRFKLRQGKKMFAVLRYKDTLVNVAVLFKISGSVIRTVKTSFNAVIKRYVKVQSITIIFY